VRRVGQESASLQTFVWVDANGIQLSVTSSILIFYGESFRMRFQEDL